MSQSTIHNPDRYMVDLRHVLSQGRKRIGLLVGAGAPVSLKVDSDGKMKADGVSLIPDVSGLTRKVLEELGEQETKVIEALLPDLGENPNIETILTRVRRLSEALGSVVVHGKDSKGFEEIAQSICERIGSIVSAELPEGQNPYTELVSWIGGTHREHPVEIFTPNYDLLFEEAFERAHLPYFDGFTGAHKPFFDATSISTDKLPPRWSRLWKIHGSLGWDISENTVVRTGSRCANKLIFPEHLKYDQITRQPFSALFERLREFLMTPDSLLICSGFSFFDAHISSVLDEALEANSHTAVLAFQFRSLSEEGYAIKLAQRRPNMSVYAKDGAIIFGLQGQWRTGQPPTEEWLKVRETFWNTKPFDQGGGFLLGDFAKLSRYFALSQASEFKNNDQDEGVSGETAPGGGVGEEGASE